MILEVWKFCGGRLAGAGHCYSTVQLFGPLMKSVTFFLRAIRDG